MHFVAYIVVHACGNVFLISRIAVEKVFVRFAFDGRLSLQVCDYFVVGKLAVAVEVVIVRRFAEHIEDGFFGRHLAVIAKGNKIIS